MNYVSHPLLVPNKVEERRYQVSMAKDSRTVNTLIILPTGLGKTIVALYATIEVLNKGKKVLLLAPTKPLVHQHFLTFSELLVNVKIGIMTGHMKPESRSKIIQDNDLIISTPQSVSNDLKSEKYSLDDFGLIIYDEAHRGTGKYSYVTIAEYNHDALSLGMTASPGSNLKKIEEICQNLSITRIDARLDSDPDVSPYVHDTYVQKIEVNIPEDLMKVISILRQLLDHYFKELTNLHLTQPNWPLSTKHMLSIGQSLQLKLARGQKTAVIYRGLSVQAICIKLLHATTLAETQGMHSLRIYLAKLNEESTVSKGSKCNKEIVARPEYKELLNVVNTTNTEHPKISKVMSIVNKIINESEGSKIIVFTQYRDTCDLLVEKISKISNVNVGKLIGQSNGGLKQKEQIKVLKGFKGEEYNVIVSTSVGEEGLDISSTNAVIFYEPIPSEIRTIQRRGRTGRKSDGEVFVLITSGTMDEVFEKSSNKKEALMRTRLEKLNKILDKNNTDVLKKGQTTLDEYE